MTIAVNQSRWTPTGDISQITWDEKSVINLGVVMFSQKNRSDEYFVDERLFFTISVYVWIFC